MTEREKLYRNLLIKKKRRGLEDLFFFNKYILESEERRRDLLVKHVHQEWTDWYYNSKSRIKMILVPRACFKSTFFTVGRTIQALCQNRDSRVLIANANLNNAQKFLSEMKDHLRKNPELIKLYGKFYDKKRWNLDEFDILGKGLGIKEASVTAVGVGGNLVSQHYSAIICDDLVNLENSSTRYQSEKVIDWWKRAFSLLDYDGEMIIIGCLTEDSKVLMGNGTWKRIVDIKVGEEVWSFDKNIKGSNDRKKLIKKKVEAVIPQGKSEVLEVKTKRHSLKATPNHPFLTVSNDKNLVWKKAEELKKGDNVVTVKQVSTITTKRWFGKKMGLDFLWLLGFLFGDGWVTKTKKTKSRSESWCVCCSLGVYEELNNKIRGMFKRYFFNKVYETKGGYIRVDCNKAGRELNSLGLKESCGAKSKRIPEWVFKLEPYEKRAFIKGIEDADGTVLKNGSRIELSSSGLIEDLYYLSLTCGIKPSHIYKRTRLIKAPNSKDKVLSKTSSLSLMYYGDPDNNNKVTLSERQTRLRGCRVEKVVSIDRVGVEDVFDLTVADTHNFISEGFIVHNTRWSYYELYSWIVEKYGEKVDTYIRGAYNPDGSLYFPELLSEEKLEELRSLQGSYIFSSFYLNDPVDEESSLIKRSQLKYWGDGDANLPRTLNIFAVCDPAVSQAVRADESSIVIVGVDAENNWWVLETRSGKWKTDELIEQLFAVKKQWNPQTMTIEVIGQAQGIMLPIHDEENRRNDYLPLHEITVRPPIKKEIRIRSVLQPRFERGKVFIKRDMFEFEEQILKFPRGKRDDMIDATTDIEEISFSPELPVEPFKSSGSHLQDLLTKEATITPDYFDPFEGYY